jgi:hypothetical protein
MVAFSVSQHLKTTCQVMSQRSQAELRAATLSPALREVVTAYATTGGLTALDRQLAQRAQRDQRETIPGVRPVRAPRPSWRRWRPPESPENPERIHDQLYLVGHRARIGGWTVYPDPPRDPLTRHPS